MITVDYALRIYTDMLITGNTIDMEYFKNNLSKTDFIEFQELIPSINLLKSTKIKEKFDKIFEKINYYKEEIYNDYQPAANFRKNKDSDTEKAKELLDQIFDYEFNDE